MQFWQFLSEKVDLEIIKKKLIIILNTNLFVNKKNARRLADVKYTCYI